MSGFDPPRLFSTFSRLPKGKWDLKSGEIHFVWPGNLFDSLSGCAAENHYLQSLDDNRGIRGGEGSLSSR